MVGTSENQVDVARGNVRLVDLTRDGVALRVARGVVRERELNRYFARHVARLPWAELAMSERRALRGPLPSPSPSVLYALDFPRSLRGAFWEEHAVAILDSGDDGGRRAAIASFRRVVLDAIGGMPGLSLREERTFDILMAPPGSASTAFDARSGEFVGLHLDDHQGLGLHERNRGFQLLGINLGFAERHLQFINHDAASLLHAIGGLESLPADGRSAASLVQRVFADFPNCHVLRMTLAPCQAYLAVTQDLIHDGSTNDGGRPDVACLLGGRFEVEGGVG